MRLSTAEAELVIDVDMVGCMEAYGQPTPGVFLIGLGNMILQRNGKNKQIIHTNQKHCIRTFISPGKFRDLMIRQVWIPMVIHVV